MLLQALGTERGKQGALLQPRPGCCNARIHAERRTVAEALQRSLLPPALPRVAGIEFGAEYVPTGEGVDVGGDFYDVMALADGAWLVVVGDVSGKGVHAATVTGLTANTSMANESSTFLQSSRIMALAFSGDPGSRS